MSCSTAFITVGVAVLGLAIAFVLRTFRTEQMVQRELKDLKRKLRRRQEKAEPRPSPPGNDADIHSPPFQPRTSDASDAVWPQAERDQEPSQDGTFDDSSVRIVVSNSPSRLRQHDEAPAVHPELFEAWREAIGVLAAHDLLWLRDFRSLEIEHDEYGLTVDGLETEHVALAAFRLLQSSFSAWPYYQVREDRTRKDRRFEVMVHRDPRPVSAA